jgi:hypothetical protein
MESMIAPSKPRRNKQTSEDIANAPDAPDQEQPLRFALFSLNVWARSEAVADFESTLTRRPRTASSTGNYEPDDRNFWLTSRREWTSSCSNCRSGAGQVQEEAV